MTITGKGVSIWKTGKKYQQTLVYSAAALQAMLQRSELHSWVLRLFLLRKMIDEIRPEETVTICLLLYLAGGEEERSFTEDYPTIAVDGCSKCCAKRATEKYSGKVTASLDLSDIIGKDVAEAGPLSTRELTE